MARSVYLSQRDVRELQFAKAAIATGWHILLEEAGLAPGDIQQVLLAGSFGSYLSPANAIRLGLVPAAAGAAGGQRGERGRRGRQDGAALASASGPAALALLEEVRYVELSDRADFNDRFIDQLPFPADLAARCRRRLIIAVRARSARRTSGRSPRRRGWPVELHSLPSLLHNRPGRIAPEVERLARAALARGLPVAVGYADCGTYGALDELCARLGLRRLPGLHCYDVLAGPARVAALFAAEPGTYLLTDFLVRSFRRSVLAELGLDRYPELWPDYFGHYRRVVWLAQSPRPGAGGRGRGGGGDVRPAADGHRHRHRPPGARAGRWRLPRTARPSHGSRASCHDRRTARAETAVPAAGCRARAGDAAGGLAEAWRRCWRDPRYEVFPAASAEDQVTEWVPRGMTVTVTASPAKGLDATLEPDRAAGRARLPGGAARVGPAGARRRPPRPTSWPG